MAKEYQLEIYGQPTPFSSKNRSLRMCFCEPEDGANEQTDIVLLIAGYGGNTSSKVYQKMRRQFADQYNLITLQCDYLGNNFMLSNQPIPMTESILRSALSPQELRSLSKDLERNREMIKGKHFIGYVNLQESSEEYNEMGIRQAMDQLMALKVLADILTENGLDFTRKHVTIYGFSHGAYLGYLCNFLAPRLFDGLIDNSAYIVPHYLFFDRKLEMEGEVFSLKKIYHYQVADWREEPWFDLESYDLSYLYGQFDNQAEILSFHGTEDDMISIKDKRNFLEHIQNAQLKVISQKEVDGEVFRSCRHGLDADFIKLFHEAYSLLKTKLGKQKINISYPFVNRSFHTEKYVYEVNWNHQIPLLEQKKWNVTN